MNGLDVLLGGFFDYAGMFPPASLSFEAALNKTAAFHRILRRPRIIGGDFVSAYDQISRLTPAAIAREGFPAGRPFKVCVLGPELPAGSASIPDQLAGLLRMNNEFSKNKGGPQIVSYEVKLSAASSLDEAAENLRGINSRLRGTPIRVFLEPQWTAKDWAAQACGFFQWLDNQRRKTGLGRVGVKVRGSGPTAVTADALGAIIPEINAENLPFKATAGLHHPIVEKRRYGNALGFLSLAAALRLQKMLGNRFGPQEIVSCLTNEDPDAFRFEDGISWGDYRIGGRELRSAMRAVPFSVGSCSIDEPDEDLSRLFA